MESFRRDIRWFRQHDVYERGRDCGLQFRGRHKRRRDGRRDRRVARNGSGPRFVLRRHNRRSAHQQLCALSRLGKGLLRQPERRQLRRLLSGRNQRRTVTWWPDVDREVILHRTISMTVGANRRFSGIPAARGTNRHRFRADRHRAQLPRQLLPGYQENSPTDRQETGFAACCAGALGASPAD